MGKILSREFKLTFSQDNDCTESDDLGQFLEVSIENGGVGSESEFFVMKTDRWSFDDIDDVINIIKEFKEEYNKLGNI